MYDYRNKLNNNQIITQNIFAYQTKPAVASIKLESLQQLPI